MAPPHPSTTRTTSHRRTLHRISAKVLPPPLDMKSATKSNNNSLMMMPLESQIFGTTQKMSWSFNSTTRLQTLLSTNSNLLGVRPLSPANPPPPHQVYRSSSSSSSYSTSQVVTFQDLNRRKSKKRQGKNLAQYLPFIQNYTKIRRKKEGKTVSGGCDWFSSLPDEMVLRVLRNLPKSSLGRMALVSKRFSRLVSDESLWERIDCIGLSLGDGQLGVICERRPDYLRLARAEVPFSALPLPPSTQLPLTHLDLTMALISPVTMQILLAASPSITHLSLEHCTLDDTVLAAVGEMKAIKVLNLSMCYGMGGPQVGNMLEKGRFQRLTEFNLSCIPQQDIEKWTSEDLIKIINALPIGLERFNFSGFRHIMFDSHTALLVSRLPNVIDLDISDSQELTGTSLEHLTKLKKLQHLSLSRCYSIQAQAYSVLGTIATLRYLEVFSLFKLESIATLSKELLKGIEINQFPLSAIARPTVGSRRSTIWGVKVRD
ncbi:S-phase kinase-associated protein 2 isoform X2 [Folsomia candida]|uniref:S-phase kinase-associated protein 2 isoform X2 n=1 Tax=Folsomia candida TaxID=158441 RepID=UPI001604DA26|nr:S-phase kinase-associated protein 2 isoform X2 [Folsomia candida]